ncbi:MMPL family transporter [Mycolicibacterium sp. CH28]|uniref:MMPL family transporter n=1 Tax=Mycolicibacterium sp. CH28 TaxID=2512237 RepID=UPI0010804E98|nr:MMPL family transporter [Mycolicibacterium sp. CH28]TGD85180.1 MMPL family transporter [Mycolicibacterium sp. CH28]
MLHRIARLALAAPKRMLLMAAMLAVAAAVFGVPVGKVLSAGGFDDPSSESSEADGLLADRFHQGDMKVLIAVTSDAGAQSDAARAAGTDIVAKLKQSPHVADVTSPWTVPSDAAGPLISKDGKTGLIIAGITGDDNAAQRYAQTLDEELAHDRDGVTVRFGGPAAVYAQISRQTERDLHGMEAIAIPLSFLVLVWVFGGLLCAAVPLMVGILAIVGSMAVLRGVASFTDVSVFSLNLSVALGLALAIDYTLLLVSRFRDELAAGADRDVALVRTMEAAGRTVVFSAVTVGLAMLPMALFPMYFLKSFAYAGVAVVSFAAIAALVVTPAAIVVLGPRLDALDLRRLGTRRSRQRTSSPSRIPRCGRHRFPDLHCPDAAVEDCFWYRSANVVIRHSVPIAVVVVALLVLAGTPFLGLKWGSPDDRVLAATASARQVGDQIRGGFAVDVTTDVTVVIRGTARVSDQELADYAARLSQVPNVLSVSAPAGAFAGGTLTGPAAGATGLADDSAFLTVASSAPLYSAASDRQLDQLHQVPAPAGARVILTGDAQTNRDNAHAVTSRLPLVLGLIGAVTFVLLFLLSGSVVIPLKALLLNVVSLTAAFGAIVWLFQEGHLGGFGTTATGTLSAAMPVLLFCIAFGISMDYEVFLVSRIREYWLASDRTPAANDECVALGLTRTGRVITAAAIIMSISFAALAAADVSFMRMFGVGLTLAILVDATIIRAVLVPALMHLMGQLNWWAPKWLARLHDRIGLSESAPGSHGEVGDGWQAPGPAADGKAAAEAIDATLAG